MSGIDDIFKNGLQDKGLEYKEAYWDDMQQLIDNSKRKKRGGFFFFVSAGMLLLGIAIGYMLFHKEESIPAERAVVSSTETPRALAQDERGIKELQHLNTSEPETAAAPVKIEQSPKAYHSKVSRPHTSSSSVTVEPADIPTTASPSVSTLISPSSENITPITITGSLLPEAVARPGIASLFPLHIKRQKNFDITMIDIKPFAIATVKDELPPPPPKAAWSYFLSAGYEYDMYSRAGSNTLLKKEETTRNSSGFNLSFSAGKNKWRIRSGLGFLKFSELTNYTTYNAAYSYDTSYSMIDPDYGQTPAGTRIALIKQLVDSTATYTPVIQSPDSRAQFSYLKIPLIASYEIGLGRFGITLDAGLNSSFLIGARGYYTVYNGSEYQIKDIRKSNDLNKTLLQTYAAAGLRYHFNKQISICGGYGWSYALNSMTKSYTQKPNINFYTFGLEFRLN